MWFASLGLARLPSFHGSSRIVSRYGIVSVERTVHVRSKGRGFAAPTPVDFDGSEHAPTRTRTVEGGSPRVPGAPATGTEIEDSFASDGGEAVLSPHTPALPSDRPPSPSWRRYLLQPGRSFEPCRRPFPSVSGSIGFEPGFDPGLNRRSLPIDQPFRCDNHSANQPPEGPGRFLAGTDLCETRTEMRKRKGQSPFVRIAGNWYRRACGTVPRDTESSAHPLSPLRFSLDSSMLKLDNARAEEDPRPSPTVLFPSSHISPPPPPFRCLSGDF